MAGSQKPAAAETDEDEDEMDEEDRMVVDDENRMDVDGEDDEETLTFGVTALRDLKENEEVVLGREWDERNTVHCLHMLIEVPHLFLYVPRPAPSPPHPPHVGKCK